MQFISNQHQYNYEILCTKYREVIENKMNQAVGYALATPGIFGIIPLDSIHNIIDWVRNWDDAYFGPLQLSEISSGGGRIYLAIVKLEKPLLQMNTS